MYNVNNYSPDTEIDAVPLTVLSYIDVAVTVTDSTVASDGTINFPSSEILTPSAYASESTDQ